MATRAIRLDRMQAGLVAWVSAILPATTVAWGRQRLPREVVAPSLATFRTISGPRSAGLGGASMRPRQLITAAILTISEIAEAESAGVSMSGIKVEHTATAGQTRGDVRDALLALLQASDILAAFAAADDGVSILATPTSPGDVYNVIGLGELTTSYIPYYGTTLIGAGGYGGQSGTTRAPYAVQTDEATYRIELQISSTSIAPMDGASSLMAELFAASDLPPTQGIRDQYGLRVDMGTPINLDRLSGPAWESREVVDIEVTLVSLAAAQATQLAQVLANIEVRNDAATLDTITVQAAGD